GGSGADRFGFSEMDSANADLILDFGNDADKIALDRAAFTNIGAIGNFAPNDPRFHSGPGATSGHDADDRIIFDTSTGNLYYDSDGDGPSPSHIFATLMLNSTLHTPVSCDFVVLAAAGV